MQLKEQSPKRGRKTTDPVFINVRVSQQTKARMAKHAKAQKLSLSKAVERLIEKELNAPAVWSMPPRTLKAAPEVVQSAPVAKTTTLRERTWWERLLNRFFG